MVTEPVKVVEPGPNTYLADDAQVVDTHAFNQCTSLYHISILKKKHKINLIDARKAIKFSSINN